MTLVIKQEGFMNLKPYAKVGKTALTNMIIAHTIQTNAKVKIENNNILLKLNYKFNNRCINCPFKESNNDNYCVDYCDNFKLYYWNEIDLSGEEISLINTDKKVHTSSQKRLSRIGDLLYFTLHFLNVDKHGIIRNIDINDMATYLHCDVKTIINNIKILNDLGLIWFSPASKYKYTVKIVGYDTYHLTAREGGKGYMHITIDILNELIEIKNVNSLRAFISLMLKHDEDRVSFNKKENIEKNKDKENIRQQENSKITLKRLRSRLPGYINNVNIINVLGNTNVTKIFDIKFNNNIVSFRVKERYNIDSYKDKLTANYQNRIEDYIQTSKLDFLEKDRDDLLQMSIQYGIDTVLNVLPNAEKEMLENDYHSNYCGFIRNKIYSSFHSNYEEAI
jgi:hypothetical protein